MARTLNCDDESASRSSAGHTDGTLFEARNA